MVASRFVITDFQWGKMEPLSLGRKRDPGRTGSDPRLFPAAVFRFARAGAPWRDLPHGFGIWNTIYRRFRGWARAGVFERIFNAVSGDPDMEMAMVPSRGLQANPCRAVDATIVKVHRAAHGAKALSSLQAAIAGQSLRYNRG